MEVNIKSRFEVGDKLSFYFQAAYHQGTIIDVVWDEVGCSFRYLIEIEDKSRNWHYERSLTGGRK